MVARIPYEEIAEIVRGWPTAGGYTQHIAATYAIPITSARRWIYEARRRGLLPSGLEPRPCRTCGGTGTAQWGTRAARESQP